MREEHAPPGHPRQLRLHHVGGPGVGGDERPGAAEEEGRAHDPQAQTRHRQDDRTLPHRLAASRGGQHREPPQPVAEDRAGDDRRDELGHGDDAERSGGRASGCAGAGPGPGRHGRGQRDQRQGEEDDRHDGEGRHQGRGDGPPDGHARIERRAEVAGQHPAQPGEVPARKGDVQPHPLAHPRHGLRTAAPGRQGGGVAGQRLDEEEEHRAPQEAEEEAAGRPPHQPGGQPGAGPGQPRPGLGRAHPGPGQAHEAENVASAIQGIDWSTTRPLSPLR